MVYWGADKSRAQSRAAFGHAAKHLHAQQHRSHQHSQGPCCLPVSSLQADSFGPLTVPLTVLPVLPELRRKESSAKLKAKAEKTSTAIYFDCPGTGISTNKDARSKKQRNVYEWGRKEAHRNVCTAIFT
jgi:hypothetical protein